MVNFFRVMIEKACVEFVGVILCGGVVGAGAGAEIEIMFSV